MDEKNEGLNPNMFSKGSGLAVWWKCEKGHEWCVSISSRNFFNTGCPICAKEREVSFPEKILAFYLHKVLPIKENVFIVIFSVFRSIV